MITWKPDFTADLIDGSTIAVQSIGVKFRAVQYAKDGSELWRGNDTHFATVDEARDTAEAYVRGARLGFAVACTFCGHRYHYPCADLATAETCGNYKFQHPISAVDMINRMIKGNAQ